MKKHTFYTFMTYVTLIINYYNMILFNYYIACVRCFVSIQQTNKNNKSNIEVNVK